MSARSSKASSTGPVPSLPTEDRVKGLSERVKRFSPAFYAITMGTGIPCTLILSSPYPAVVSHLKIPAIIFLLFDTLLFVVFTLTMTMRYTRFPEIWPATWVDRTHSLAIGTVPMSMLTLISGAVSVSQLYNMGESWLYVMSGLWWLSVVVSIVVAFVVPYLAFTSHRNLPDSITSALLLPVVPLITCAAIGAVLADHFTHIDPIYAIKIWVASYVVLGPGLLLALFIMTLYLQRLTFHHIPTQETIVSSFLPLGPTGLGGFSLLRLGSVAIRLLPIVDLGGSSSPNLDAEARRMAGIALWGSGLAGALLLFGLGMWWMFLAIASLVYRWKEGHMRFNTGFWALTFPLASLTLSTLQIGKELNSDGFKVLGSIFTLAVCLNVLILLVLTGRGVVQGSRSVFAAPCVDRVMLGQKAEKEPTETKAAGLQ